jgi:hypothetical protein
MHDCIRCVALCRIKRSVDTQTENCGMSTAEIRDWMNGVQNSAVEQPETQVVQLC